MTIERDNLSLEEFDEILAELDPRLVDWVTTVCFDSLLEFYNEVAAELQYEDTLDDYLGYLEEDWHAALLWERRNE